MRSLACALEVGLPLVESSVRASRVAGTPLLSMYIAKL